MTARRFQGGSYLAWALEKGAGYRSTAKIEWSFTSLDELRLAKGHDIDVGELIGEAGRVPPVSIEPTIEGSVSILAREPLVLWPLGETEATLESSREEVDYGTTVRLGPLLLAPIDDEQHEAILHGRLRLSEPPAVLDTGRRRDSGSDFLLIAAARRKMGRLWLGSFFGAFLLTVVNSLMVNVVEQWGHSGGFHFRWDVLIFFSIGQCIPVFAVSAPLHAAIMRWAQTPGYWEDEDERGIGWPAFVAVPFGALVLFGSPWIVGIIASLLVTAVVCQPTYGIYLEDVLILGFFMSILLSFVACIVMVMLVKDRHRIVIWWFGPPSRHLEADVNID